MKLRESDLYAPIKAFLEAQGYGVKSEVSNCDVVALRDGEDPIIVELKTALNLQLLFQAIDRQALSETVYIAFAMPARRSRRDFRDVVKLGRRLGLGLITVDAADRRQPVEVHLDPGPYRPRQSKRRRGMLLREFQRRVGDPNVGGTNKRTVMTAYRQDALRCAHHLGAHGPSTTADIRNATGVAHAARQLQRDVYGWFTRVERGTYALTPNGERALATFADVVKTLTAPD